MKKDIKDREDIEKLVNAFYCKIKADKEIIYFFDDVAKVNWKAHMLKMYGFFENILFSEGNYDGNPMIAHEELHKKSPVNLNHFNHWNTLFEKTVDELFAGDKAEEIKRRAINISAAMIHKTLG